MQRFKCTYYCRLTSTRHKENRSIVPIDPADAHFGSHKGQRSEHMICQSPSLMMLDEDLNINLE
jgi:hypothetical protein